MTTPRAHLELAAKLWGLALIAHTDVLDADDEAARVRQTATKRAKQALTQLGTNLCEIFDEEDALEVAKRLLSTPTP